LRIDLFLHRIRLAKSRTQAQALIAQGTARIDGKRVEKPSEPVRVGSIIAFAQRGRVRIIRVLALPDRRGPPAEARTAYEELEGT
jgi:ribosome-associated heat shock protein Hsp15